MEFARAKWSAITEKASGENQRTRHEIRSGNLTFVVLLVAMICLPVISLDHCVASIALDGIRNNRQL